MNGLDYNLHTGEFEIPSYINNIHYWFALSGGAIEYIDCFSVEGVRHPSECP